MVDKANVVLGKELLGVSLLRYWAEHDKVVRQIYNSLIDLGTHKDPSRSPAAVDSLSHLCCSPFSNLQDASTRACTMNMQEELQELSQFRELIIGERRVGRRPCSAAALVLRWCCAGAALMLRCCAALLRCRCCWLLRWRTPLLTLLDAASAVQVSRLASTTAKASST